MEILLYIIILFAGFAVGRIGHILGGHLKDPHHWIYGLILIIGGFLFIHKFFAVSILIFGIGLFVSDLNDFLHMRFYGVDNVKIKKFWAID